MRPFIGAVAALAFGLVVWAAPQGGEQKVPLDKVPKAVMDTVKARFPGAKLIGASSEKTGDKLIYEVELEFKGLHHDVTLEPDGKLTLIEREIAFKNLPKKVQKTLQKANPKATYKLIEEVIKVAGGKDTLEYYEAHLETADKKEVEVIVLPDGTLKPAAQPEGKKGDDKKEKTTGKKAKDDFADWTTHFAVDKKDLVSVGRNPYFILEPGYDLVLEGGDERIVVSVLHETKMVDGVETRVVVEDETKGGKQVEISRNYFAICKRSNSVYYFGEDVDIYKNGKVVGHPGAWLSGEKGAKFGLMMPGLPLVKARYYQEIAPGVALDRAEIVSVTETLKTPAGEFKNCLKTLETTPLEPETRDFKVYAPGIGLIQDGKMKLVRYG
ncbi:MAG TPA: hypothetical protein VEL76_26010, partial [Gemmataceae bacterium]|nr:hypothetical protein [Gemmataceae bacterium]